MQWDRGTAPHLSSAKNRDSSAIFSLRCFGAVGRSQPVHPASSGGQCQREHTKSLIQNDREFREVWGHSTRAGAGNSRPDWWLQSDFKVRPSNIVRTCLKTKTQKTQPNNAPKTKIIRTDTLPRRKGLERWQARMLAALGEDCSSAPSTHGG